MKLKSYFLFLILFPIVIFAAEKQPICSHSGLHFSHNNLVFFAKGHSVKPGLYAIQNKSNQPLWLNHTLKNNPGVSAGWASAIAPDHWSAILMTRRPAKFAMQCQYQEKMGRAVNVSCKKVLHACQLEGYLSHKPIMSSYWVAENLSHKGMMKRLHVRGFSFPANIKMQIKGR